MLIIIKINIWVIHDCICLHPQDMHNIKNVKKISFSLCYSVGIKVAIYSHCYLSDD